jgi:hypothetical protein
MRGWACETKRKEELPPTQKQKWRWENDEMIGRGGKIVLQEDVRKKISFIHLVCSFIPSYS